MVKIKSDSFSGVAKVYDGTLADALRQLAINDAFNRIDGASITDFTDNSTGVDASGVIVDMVLPTAVFDATATDGAPQAGYNTAAEVIEDVTAVLVEHFNDVRTLIGLDAMSNADGTIALSDTIPAMTKALTGVQGATAINYQSGLASMVVAKSHIQKLVRAYNEIATAVGGTLLTNGLTGQYDNDYALAAIPVATADDDGAESISDTVMDAFLDAAADNVATIAAAWTNLVGTGMATTRNLTVVAV